MEAAASDAPVCAKCGSRHLLPDLPLLADDNKLYCKGETYKIAFLPLATIKAEVTATVCVDCGHTEFRVPDTSALRRIYDQNR